MKFKIIFLLFNSVILFSFLILFFMPLFLLGWDYTRIFWAKNWYLPCIVFVVICALNIYFFLNWKLFRLLEKEDWGNVVSYLEDRVYKKGSLSKQNIRILSNAYVILSNLDGISSLEKFLREKKPGLLKDFTLIFGVPYILRNDYQAMKDFFSEFLDGGGKDRDWIEWNYSFSLMFLEEHDKAMTSLKKLAGRVKEPVLLLLTIYLLNTYSGSDEEIKALVDSRSAGLVGKFSPALLDDEIGRRKENIVVMILSKLISQASEWLYDQS